MNDLFADPRVAVGKTDTSFEAACAIQPKASVIRERVLEEIKRLGALGGTPSEIAPRIKELLLNVRPRCTELRAAGAIKDSGKRRRNGRGKNEIVWVAE
ncbi:MAG: hypothetical protein AB7I36_08375 [Rhodospirillaceae bacterium]